MPNFFIHTYIISLAVCDVILLIKRLVWYSNSIIGQEVPL